MSISEQTNLQDSTPAQPTRSPALQQALSSSSHVLTAENSVHMSSENAHSMQAGTPANSPQEVVTSMSVDEIYAEHVRLLQRANPSIIVPSRRKSKNLFDYLISLVVNYILPTTYMRFALVRFYYRLTLWLKPTKKIKPYVPQPSLRKRKIIAEQRMRRPIFHEPKVIASFHLGGGVGKTTTILLRGAAIKRTLPYLDVTDMDCDDGTLIQRVVRTSVLSILDFLVNLKVIKRSAHLLPYCTVTEHGLKVMAYRREDELDDVDEMTREEMVSVIDKVTDIESIVLCDLAPNKAGRTRGALDRTHQVQIVTTPANDRLDQAVTTFSWLLANDYEHLARTAVIIINDYKTQADVDKVKERFASKHHAHMNDVRFNAIRHNKKLMDGGKVSLSLLGKREEVLLLEDTATMLEGLADAFSNNPASQVTHLEARGRATTPDPTRVIRVAKSGKAALSDGQTTSQLSVYPEATHALSTTSESTISDLEKATRELIRIAGSVDQAGVAVFSARKPGS